MKGKSIFKTLTLLLVLALTSGCMKVERGMNISFTNDVEEYYIYGVMSALTSQGNYKSEMDSNSEDLKKAGYTISDYSDNKYTGIKATKKLKSLNDLSYEGELKTIDLDKTDDNTKYFRVEKGFLKNTYTAKFSTKVSSQDILDDYSSKENEETNPDEELYYADEEEVDDESLTTLDETPTEGNDDAVDSSSNTSDGSANQVDSSNDNETPISQEPTDSDDKVPTEVNDDGTTKEEGSDSILDDESKKQILSTMEINYKVTLPSKALSNNATKVEDDGKTLVWDMREWKDDQYVEFSFEAWNITNLLIVGGGALLLLIILIVVIIVVKKKKGKVAPAPLAEKPIVEVTDAKTSSLTPVNPTMEAAPALAPEEKKEEVVAPAIDPTKIEEIKPVAVSVPEVETSAVAVPPTNVEVSIPEPVIPTVAVEAPKEEAPTVTVPVPEVTTPEEAKTE